MQTFFPDSLQSLYIHWPFCPYKCHFCPFVAFSGLDHLMQQYHQALTTEITDFAQKIDLKGSLKSIYFGGGTPSTYPTGLLLDMFAILNDRFVLTESTEITLEVNPGTVTKEKIQAWKQIGINRLSVGVQSLNATVLKNLNRNQSAQDVYAFLRDASPLFDAISVDLILGLPGVSDNEWREMVHQVVIWPIAHVSVYFLTIHENTPLYKRVQKKEVLLPCDDGVVDLYHWTRDVLQEHGFEQYEISSFAKSGYRSKHNRAYWDRTPFKGFGVGAWSFDGSARMQNDKNLLSYIKKAGKSESVVACHDALSADMVYMEKVMLGMRQSKGVCVKSIVAGLSVSKKERLYSQIALLSQKGFVKSKNGRVTMTPQGLAVEHAVAQALSV